MLKISEIFHSIQGESTHAGRPCTFVRLAGCDLRCHWCDTEYAFYDGKSKSLETVLEQVRAYGCSLVEVTGGEPLLQPEAIPLLQALLDEGFETMLETGGHRSLEQVPDGVRKIVDVKCPGSGEHEKHNWENLQWIGPGDELKFVIADRADFDWAVAEIRQRALADRCTVLLSAVTATLAPGRLADWVLEEKLPVRVQIQLHKQFWPASKRGV